MPHTQRFTPALEIRKHIKHTSTNAQATENASMTYANLCHENNQLCCSLVYIKVRSSFPL